VAANKITGTPVPDKRLYKPETVNAGLDLFIFRIIRLQIFARVVWCRINFADWYFLDFHAVLLTSIYIGYT
jgi:hypothetical protein